MDQTNHRAVVASAWAGMLAVLIVMLLLEPLRFAMKGEYAVLSERLRADPGRSGLAALVVLICLNVLVQVVVQARACRLAKVAVLVSSVLYGLFFLGHNIVHLMGGEPLGLQSLLDGTHHVLAAFAIWASWRWCTAQPGVASA